MYRIYFLSLLTLLFVKTTYTQSKQCGTDRASEILQSNDTNYFKRIQESQKIVENYIKYLEANPNLRIGNADITIPVVVNIVYKNSDENISNEIVQTQIDQLNADFNRLNDQSNIPSSILPIVGTPNIQFCLQNINRASTTISKFVLPDPGATGGNINILETIISPFIQNTYLNIYIADIGSIATNGTMRDDLGGFTFLPSSISNLVYMDYTRFGNPGINNDIAGHILTHEVGHWLGLCHPWTSSSNCIQGVPNMPTTHTSAYMNCDDNGGTIPTYMNFLEYKNNDNCRTMFTSGQVLIMRAMLSASNPYSNPSNQAGPLYPIISSSSLDPNRCSFNSSLACPSPMPSITNIIVNEINSTTVNIHWDRTPNAIAYILRYKLSTTTTWTSVTTTNPSITLTGLTPPPATGTITYNYQIQPVFVADGCVGPFTTQANIVLDGMDFCNNFTFSNNEPNNIISQPLSYSNVIIPDNSTHTITISDNLFNSSDVDWFRVKTNAGQNSMRIILVTPNVLTPSANVDIIKPRGLDYDLEIYDCSGNFLRSSNNIQSQLLNYGNRGTSIINVYFREYITLNNIIPQTDYYIRIIDNNPANQLHLSGCYTITITENNSFFTNY